MQFEKCVAIVGSGPAGLMAAHVLSRAGVHVTVFEKRPSAGRKILIAGSSGLNISNELPLLQFADSYQGPPHRWKKTLELFTPQAWIQFIEALGLETFCGTSGRYFVRGMKGSSLLRAWVDALKSQGVLFEYNHSVTDFVVKPTGLELIFEGNSVLDAKPEFKVICFCMGGGSWEKTPVPVSWPQIFISKGLGFTAFVASNSGFKVEWGEKFLKEAEGQPLKNIVFTSKKGSRAGELMITSYGLEGTPVYSLGETGEVWIDLVPNLSLAELTAKLKTTKENLSPMRRVKKNLNLSVGKLALVFHGTPPPVLQDLAQLIARLKSFPITLGERQPLQEAISSSGGLAWAELDDFYMIKKIPGVFAAGEMLDWDAPTGGFLIQGSVSQGHAAGLGILDYLENSDRKLHP
jgi:uncharacterized flavoprotein (TIGR03862 family)